jgi:hypothetical protein
MSGQQHALATFEDMCNCRHPLFPGIYPSSINLDSVDTRSESGVQEKLQYIEMQTSLCDEFMDFIHLPKSKILKILKI